MDEGEAVKRVDAGLARLDEAIMRGLAGAAAGRTKPAEEVFDRLEAKYRERLNGKKVDPGSSRG